MLFLRSLFVSVFLTLSSFLWAETETPQNSSADESSDGAQSRKVELIKKVVQLNRDLYAFEEELLRPVETQFSVFLGMAEETRFTLDSIEIQLNDQLIASYLYQEKEIKALQQGGIQQLYVGSLSDGKHKLSASFKGQSGNGQYFRRKKAIKFSKKQKSKFVQLVVSEDRRTGEPLFKVKQW